MGIIELKKVEAPRLANFDEVKDKVKEELIGLRKKEAALEKERQVKIRYDLFLKINSDVLSRYGGEEK